MNKALPPSRKRRRSDRTRPLGLFAGGVTAVFLTAGIFVKTRQDDLPYVESPSISSGDTPNCRNVFRIAASPDSAQALDAMMEKIDTADLLLLKDGALLQKLGHKYAMSRGYVRSPDPKTGHARAYHFQPNEPHVLMKRLSWDLRVLSLYAGETADKFTPDLIDALGAFQHYNSLEETRQPDIATLKLLSQEAMRMRVMITMEAYKAGIEHKVPVSDILQLIDAESEGNPQAAAKTSTALGLGQFTEGTWREQFAKHGKKLGYEGLQTDAVKIVKLRKAGQALPPDLQKSDQIILSMRTQPGAAIKMIVFYGLELGNGVFSAGQVYSAFMLGAGGDSTLRKNPDKPAAKLLPDAAAANKSVFFTKKGKMRTGQEVLGELYKRVMRADRVHEASVSIATLNTLFANEPVKVRNRICAPPGTKVAAKTL